MNNYSVFILRCWKDGNRVRFRLENPRTAQTHLFTSTKELDQFLSDLFEIDALTQNHKEGDSDATI